MNVVRVWLEEDGAWLSLQVARAGLGCSRCTGQQELNMQVHAWVQRLGDVLYGRGLAGGRKLMLGGFASCWAILLGLGQQAWLIGWPTLGCLRLAKMA